MTEIPQASTLVLLRDHEPSFQLLMLRRHHNHEFMANAWVFPGGRVEPRDRNPELTDHFGDFDAAGAAGRLGDDVDSVGAIGLYAAAIRETFEEAGLVLAGGRDDHCPPIADDTDLDEIRRQLADDTLDLVDIARDFDLVFTADSLVYFAHWITPPFETRRYDTRFFAARAPEDQRHRHDDHETTHSAWWTPNEAIERYRDQRILLAPPTLRTLEDLATYSSVDDALDTLAKRPAPPAIMPHPVEIDDGRVVLALPGDPDYPHGDEKIPEPTGGVTRMERRDGQWYSIRRRN